MAGSAEDVLPRSGGRVPLSLGQPALTQVVASGFRWWVRPEQRELLLGPSGLRLDEWLQTGQAHIIKKGPHRIVYRVDLPGLSFFIKHHLVPDLQSWLRQMIRPSKARMEHDCAHEVAACGVATFVPLALGEQQAFLGAGESILVTQTLENTEPLHVFAAETLFSLPAARQTRLRQLLARELGKLVAHMHDAGILHNDLHAGNLLVRPDDEDRLSLFLIDLNSVRLGQPLNWEKSQENLAMLNRWFVLRASRTDRLRFWQTYRRMRRQGKGCEGLASEEFMVLAAEVEKRTWTSNMEFWKYRDERCRKNNRYYRCVKSATASGHSVTDLNPDTLKTLLEDPDEPFRRPGVKLLKDSPTSTVAELEMVVDGQPRPVIYKRFRMTAWSDPWTALVRPTPALRSWIHGQGFRERGLPTARPLAVLHRRRAGLCLEGYLLTEKISNAQTLHEFMDSLEQLPPRQRRQLLRRQIVQVAQVIREMHRRSLSHRDLKAANVLVSRDVSKFFSPFSSAIWASKGQSLLPIFATSVWVIDLVGVEPHKRLPRSRRLQNLTRLSASFFRHPGLTRSDRLRFLKVYMHWNMHGAGDWKRWWKAIDRATQEKIARNLRRGRPLG